MDSMIVRLAGNEYYCFLDGFSGYFQIPIDPRDQEIDHLLVPTERQYGSLHGGLLGLWEFPLKIALRLEENVAKILGSPRSYHKVISGYPHFCNDQFAKVMQKYGVTHRLSTAYHPQTSGQVEVSNRGLKRILERTIGENRASWEKKENHGLLRSKNRFFNVGDRVLLFNSRLKIFSGKLKSRWSGPFTITQVFPYGTIELSQANGPNFKVNGHRVKHYFGGDVPQLVVPDLQTFPNVQ
ncbi:reverse transcriptase domain-containing protein [Tanacetum coccineum]|uniref:Reverse transcriptase domain-containing protein n=1 Tax=Tanacetum coccineum TaxID=301880 RepID=A0ABQ5BR04_9ASTR